MDEEATEKYAEVPKEQYKWYAPGCHTVEDNFHYTMTCDSLGVHQRFYSDDKCQNYTGKNMPNGGKLNYEWNTCEKAPGVDIWFVARTTQVFRDENGPAILF